MYLRLRTAVVNPSLKEKEHDTTETIRILKQTPIQEYLASLGHYPLQQAQKELQYFSPLRIESTPSFFVNPTSNVFMDFGGEKGDIIRLVMLMNGISFTDACKMLEAWSSNPAAPVLRNPSKAPDSEISLIKAIQLRSPALIRYAESRKIPFLLAAKYCKEVHYRNGNKNYYALGFQSDLGGFELRNRIGDKDFKSCIPPKGISTLIVSGSDAVHLFEGFFDFLSALVYFEAAQAKHSVVVLNSTSNLKSSQEHLARHSKIYAYLDNDKGGRNALKTLTDSGHQVIDRSRIYSQYKDFSEMLVFQN